MILHLIDLPLVTNNLRHKKWYRILNRLTSNWEISSDGDGDGDADGDGDDDDDGDDGGGDDLHLLRDGVAVYSTMAVSIASRSTYGARTVFVVQVQPEPIVAHPSQKDPPLSVPPPRTPLDCTLSSNELYIGFEGKNIFKSHALYTCTHALKACRFILNVESTIDITEFFRKLKCVCHWADPFKDLKWSNVPGVKLSSLFKSDDTFLSLQALSDLYYLSGGFMDYLWSHELDISNFGPADRRSALSTIKCLE
nr:hypothetical protein [Tanacetum cinerariifolium]